MISIYCQIQRIRYLLTIQQTESLLLCKSGGGYIVPILCFPKQRTSCKRLGDYHLKVSQKGIRHQVVFVEFGVVCYTKTLWKTSHVFLYFIQDGLYLEKYNERYLQNTVIRILFRRRKPYNRHKFRSPLKVFLTTLKVTFCDGQKHILTFR